MPRAFSPYMEPTVIESPAEPEVVPRSFEEFFHAERDRLYGTLWLVTRNRHEAEEISQDAFLKVWERWDEVREMAEPAGYLCRTAMNVWRSRGRRTSVALRKAVRALPPDDELAAIDERDVVVRTLAVLTPRQRAAIVLVDLLGFTSEEAGNALGVRPSTVRVLAARARTTLREGMDRR
ncbi:MAG: RNA polymerase sigma factor [Actinomycetota bacterium]